MHALTSIGIDLVSDRCYCVADVDRKHQVTFILTMHLIVVPFITECTATIAVKIFPFISDCYQE